MAFSHCAKYDLLHGKSNDDTRSKCLYNQYELPIRGILETQLLTAFTSDLELSKTGLRVCEGWEGSWWRDSPLRCTDCINAKIILRSQPFNEEPCCFLLMPMDSLIFPCQIPTLLAVCYSKHLNPPRCQALWV